MVVFSLKSTLFGSVVLALGFASQPSEAQFEDVKCPEEGYIEVDSGTPSESGEGVDQDRGTAENDAKTPAEMDALTEISDAQIACNSGGNNYFDSDYEDDMSCILSGNNWECDYSIEGKWVCCEIEV